MGRLVSYVNLLVEEFRGCQKTELLLDENRIKYTCKGRSFDGGKHLQYSYVGILMEFCWLMGSLGGWVLVLDVTLGVKRRKLYARMDT